MTNERAETLFDQARSAYDEERLEDAATLIGRAMRVSPDDAKLYEFRAAIWNDIGQHQYAIADANRAIRLKPGSVPAHVERGNALLQTRQFGDAASDFTRAIEMLPPQERSPLLFSRGRAFAYARHYDDAIEDFTRVIKEEGDDPEAYNERGFTYAQAGRLAKALKDLNHAVELDPANPTYRLNRGSTLFNMNRKDEAEKDWEEAIRLGKKDPGLVTQLKRRYELLGKPFPGARKGKATAATAPPAEAVPATVTAKSRKKAPAATASEAAPATPAKSPRSRKTSG